MYMLQYKKGRATAIGSASRSKISKIRAGLSQNTPHHEVLVIVKRSIKPQGLCLIQITNLGCNKLKEEAVHGRVGPCPF
jgi:hypothetical protein